MKSVIIAGGGTGGHIFPAVAIGHAIKRQHPDVQLLFVGAIGKMEMEKVPREGFPIVGLDIAGFNRSSIWKNWNLPFKLWKSRIKAKSLLKEHQPDIVIGVGGYASFPMLHMAQQLGIPTLIQEQNSHAGKSNIILGKKAAKVCVAYEHMDTFFPAEKIVMTGNPVRALISQNQCTAAAGKQAMKVSPNRPTLLVVGGSLGALSINKAIAAGLASLAEAGIDVIWQTGTPFVAEAAALAKDYPNVQVHEFIYEMDKAYAAADIIVSRAGAMAISELCIVGKPVIFVPYPFAAEDHQTVNAQSLVQQRAAMMVRNDAAADHLIENILQLNADETLQKELSSNISKLAIKDADQRILLEIQKIVSA